MLKTGEDRGGIPRGMVRAAKYAPFAMRHNWTPKQVDEEVPLDVKPWLIIVEDMIKEIAEDNYKREHPQP